MDEQTRRDFTTQNLSAWNEAAPIHATHNQDDLLKLFSKPGFSILDDTISDHLNRLGVKGSDVAQVCCNNGREILSVRNLGAKRCVGFDGAQAFLDQGQALAEAAGQSIEFVCCDAYELPKRFRGAFDLVVITIGVLSWMPDLPRFFEGVATLLKPGGALLIYEQHPILEMFEPGGAEDAVAWELSYFHEEPYVETGGLDYYGGKKYASAPVTSFMHKMSEVIMAGVNAGLGVENFDEHPHHISNTWYNVEASQIGVPMCYTLVFRKPL